MKGLFFRNYWFLTFFCNFLHFLQFFAFFALFCIFCIFLQFFALFFASNSCNVRTISCFRNTFFFLWRVRGDGSVFWPSFEFWGKDFLLVLCVSVENHGFVRPHRLSETQTHKFVGILEVGSCYILFWRHKRTKEYSMERRMNHFRNWTRKKNREES